MANQNLIDTFLALRASLHRVACRLLSDDDEAQDAVSDTLLRLWDADSPPSDEATRYRLFAVLRNLCISRLRGRRREAVEEQEPERSVSPVEPEEVDARREELLGVLTPLQRQVFEMAAFGEMDYDIIALRLGLSEEAVRAHVCRARRKLREQFKKLNQ